MAVWAPGLAAAATPEDGRRAYDAGRFRDAMGIWAELLRQGNAEAAFGLGLLLDLGNGTPEDPEAAFSWYKFAAEAGVPEAEFNVGAMYDSGRGVAQSRQSAALWYAKAAARGHHRAQYVLGLLYEQGEGVPRNLDAAAAWFHKAADGGIAAAGSRLKTLQATAQPRPSDQLTAAELAAPARTATITVTEGNRAVELVWVAAPEPQLVHYEVQVRELGTPDLQIVFIATVAETAVLVRLPITADFYVWNVDTVGRDGSRVRGEWSWFGVEDSAPSEQSVASLPEKSQSQH